MKDTLKRIRESERQSHTEIYSNEKLYDSDSWLKKPINSVLELLPMFADHNRINILDLGCGVGRNCLPFAIEYKSKCDIVCVDILDIAINKLNENAISFSVDSAVKGYVSAIEDFIIDHNKYDLIMAISALEHIDSKESFIKKLYEIKSGLRKNGIVLLVVNSEIQEFDNSNGIPLSPQFEVNLATDELQNVFNNVFAEWSILKNSVSFQEYDIPRNQISSHLQTNVITYIAKNTNRKEQ